jgi:hypothetical protein
MFLKKQMKGELSVGYQYLRESLIALQPALLVIIMKSQNVKNVWSIMLMKITMVFVMDAF